MAHALNLVKLCVGVDSVATLQAFVASRSRGGRVPTRHSTRMRPTRADEIVDGGALYWVIGGAIRCRQTLLAVEPSAGEDGAPRVDLVLEPLVIETAAWPRRPFQGWRYLKADEAPPDLSLGSLDAAGAADETPPGALLEAIAAVGVRWSVR